MAKTLIKNIQELINFAHQYRIETEGKTVQEIGQELTNKLMTYYDEYYMYIDNGKQMKEAQERNREIEEEVAAIKKVVTEFKDDAHALLEAMDDVAQETIEKKETEIMTTNLSEELIKRGDNKYLDMFFYISEDMKMIDDCIPDAWGEDYSIEDDEQLVEHVIRLRMQLAFKALKIALNNNYRETAKESRMKYRVLDSSKTFFCDICLYGCYKDADNSHRILYSVRTAHIIGSGPVELKNDFGCIVNLNEQSDVITEKEVEMFIKELTGKQLEWMMKELTEHGYTYSRALTPEEIKREYADMIEDMEVIKAVENGADIADALNNINKKEESAMTENKTTTNNTVQEQEEVTMEREIRKMVELLEQLKQNQKTSDAGYIKKDALRKILENDFNLTFSNKTSRERMIEGLVAMYQDYMDRADEMAYENAATDTDNKATAEAQGETAEDATQAIQDAQLKLAKQACEEAIGYSVDTMSFYLAVLNMYNDIQEARKQAAAEIDHAKVNTVNETPKAEPKTENKPAMPISQSNVAKESEVLPNTVAETKYQFNVAQCSQVIGRILMDSAAQEVFGTISDHILRSHIASVLFNKTMNVMKNGKFTKEKTKFSEYETGAINEFITRLLSNGYIKLNESKASYSLSDAIKDRKGVWKHEATGTQYIVDYKKGVFAKRGGKDVYKLSDYKVFKDGTKKLNRYVLQDTCVFQGLTPVAKKDNK